VKTRSDTARWVAAAAVLALIAAGTAGAQTLAFGQSGGTQPGEQPELLKPRQISGRVIESEDVPAKDTDRVHQVVLLEIEEGRRLSVDLGSKDALLGRTFAPGQTIEVRGLPARAADEVDLFANIVTVDGQTISIERPEPEQQPRQ
jgi:hypothetical protein